MIRLIQGTVHSHTDCTIILFTNGIGYHIFTPSSLQVEDSEELTLFIHTHVREDDIKLFGFRTKNELNFFELLLTINGVGPKMALAILDEPPEQIQNAIFSGNILALTKISGVGKKIAERIILELKNKVIQTEDQPTQNTGSEIDDDVIITLESLGYKRNHIQKVLSSIEIEDKETEDIIRLFLQNV